MNILDFSFNFLKKEWKKISAYPWTFAGFFILALVLTFMANKWRYEGIIENLREREESYKERIYAKDDQLTEYRERLHLVSASGSEYSFLTHLELKNKTLKFVQEIRKWHESKNLELNRSANEGLTAVSMASTEDEKNRLWHEYTNKEILLYLRLKAEYDQKFKVDSIVLRDELLTRLPKETKDKIITSMYEHPTNLIVMGEVIDDLERMAKLLK